MPLLLNKSISQFTLHFTSWLIHPTYRSQRLLDTYRLRVAAIIIFFIPCLTTTVDLLHWLTSMSGAPVAPFSYAALGLGTVALSLFRWTTVSPFLVSLVFIVILRSAGLILAVSMAKGTGSPEYICFPVAIVLTFLLLDRRRATYVCIAVLLANIGLRWLEHRQTGQVWTASPAAYRSQTEIFVFMLTIFAALCLFAYSHLYKLTMKEFQQEQEYSLFLLKMEGLADLAFNFSTQCKPYLYELKALENDTSQQIAQDDNGSRMRETSDRLTVVCQELAKVARSFVHFSHPSLSLKMSSVDMKETLLQMETIVAGSLSCFQSTLTLVLSEPLPNALSQQSHLVLLLAALVQHESQQANRDIRVYAGAVDGRIFLEIVGQSRQPQKRMDRRDQLRSNIFLELIRDLRTEAAAEVFVTSSSGSTRYCVFLKKFAQSTSQPKAL